jgi:hypothetical protein
MNNKRKERNSNINILTNNNKIKSNCIYCSKIYTNISSLEKHMLFCKIVNQSKQCSKNKIKEIESEKENLPSHEELYFIVKELMFKINKLEEKLSIQDKYINKTKKKIKIIDWLTSNKIPDVTIETFVNNNIFIKEEDILFMMHNSFLDTLDKIFSDNFAITSNENLPIFCLDNKQNIFYIYSNKDRDTKVETDIYRNRNSINNNNNNNSWIDLNKTDCIKLMNIIYSKVFKKLMEWKKNNEDQLNKSEPLDNLYMKTMGKLLGIDFKHETTLSRSKTLLFNKIKTDMKNIIEYELEI